MLCVGSLCMCLYRVCVCVVCRCLSCLCVTRSGVPLGRFPRPREGRRVLGKVPWGSGDGVSDGRGGRVDVLPERGRERRLTEVFGTLRLGYPGKSTSGQVKGHGSETHSTGTTDSCSSVHPISVVFSDS